MAFRAQSRRSFPGFSAAFACSTCQKQVTGEVFEAGGVLSVDSTKESGHALMDLKRFALGSSSTELRCRFRAGKLVSNQAALPVLRNELFLFESPQSF